MFESFSARGAHQSAQVVATSAAQNSPLDSASPASQAATASQHRTPAATWSDVPPPAKLLGLAGAPCRELCF